MNITKAFCVELGRSINIVDARNAYFAQKVSIDEPERKKLTFLCSSPECRSNSIEPVAIIGVNHYRVIEDNPSYRRPYFRSKDILAHSPDCRWVIEDSDQQQRIDNAKDHASQSRLKREYKDGYINHSTFLIKKAGDSKKPANEVPEKNDDLDVDLVARESGAEVVANKKEPRQALVNNTRKSGSFSKLVSDYLEIHRKKEWDTELYIEGMKATSYSAAFRYLKNFKAEHSASHIHYGSVSVSKLLPENFDFSEGSLPNAVILRFDQEVSIGSTTTKPTLMIKRAMFEDTASAHVLAETIKKALQDPDYSDRMWCHFYGEVVEHNVPYTDKETGNRTSFTTLKVEPKGMDMIELVLRKNE